MNKERRRVGWKRSRWKGLSRRQWRDLIRRGKWRRRRGSWRTRSWRGERVECCMTVWRREPDCESSAHFITLSCLGSVSFSETDDIFLLLFCNSLPNRAVTVYVYTVYTAVYRHTGILYRQPFSYRHTVPTTKLSLYVSDRVTILMSASMSECSWQWLPLCQRCQCVIRWLESLNQWANECWISEWLRDKLRRSLIQ